MMVSVVRGGEQPDDGVVRGGEQLDDGQCGTWGRAAR